MWPPVPDDTVWCGSNYAFPISSTGVTIIVDWAHYFPLQFLPHSGDSMLVSGAADCKIQVHDVSTSETTQVFSCHAGRVKRLATAPNVPFMFWSAAEDGTIMWVNIR